MRRRVLLAVAVVAATAVVAAQGVRVVDAVLAGNVEDEAAHHVAGEATATGRLEQRTWRSAAGWFSYSLRIYDDSPLTIVCLLAEGDGTAEAFDIVVDGKRATTVRREPGGARPAEIRLQLPLAETAGKTSVTVAVTAHRGLRTGRVLEIRSLQEHLEGPLARTTNDERRTTN